MRDPLWDETRWISSGLFFVLGLWEFRKHIQKAIIWKQLKKCCTQRTQGTVALEEWFPGKSGGQEVTITYDVGEQHFNQVINYRYKRDTFQWLQKVTVCYDPRKPKDFYVEEHWEQIRSNMVWGMLLDPLWCLFFGASMLSGLSLLFQRLSIGK